MTRQDQVRMSKEALHAMQRAVKGVISDRRKAGRPIFILKDGKIAKVFLSPAGKNKKR